MSTDITSASGSPANVADVEEAGGHVADAADGDGQAARRQDFDVARVGVGAAGLERRLAGVGQAGIFHAVPPQPAAGAGIHVQRQPRVGLRPHRRHGLRREHPAELGLQSMRERIAACGGRIEIRSEQGKGTRICTELPMLSSEQPAAPAAPAAPASS